MKDDSGGVISKNILDWLTTVGAITTILAGVLGLFLPEENAKKVAWGIAFVLAVASTIVYFYQRRQAAKLKIAESAEPLSASAALRGLLPFEEGDELPGRGRDVQDVFTLVSSSIFRFGVLWGESGCGKTSLLRAGLVPRLKNEKYLPLYIHKPTNDPQEAIRLALARELGESTKKSDKDLKTLLKAAIPKGKKIIILFDQFEEFFLTNRTASSRTGFIKWLGNMVNDENLPIAFLIGIRGDFFVQLQNFHPQIPEPTSTRSTYQLQNFDTEQAKQIFSTAAKADGIPFEPELIQAVIRELETEEFIRPAELQVVGTRLKRKNIFTLNRYEVLGGARGILSSYISDEIKQSKNEHTARLVLRLMCADVIETKSQTDLSLDDILHGVSGIEQSGDTKASGHSEEIQAILNQFVTARVLIHTDDDKYNLVHDYLAPYVRTATEGTETNTERANRMLKRYVAEYKEDPKTRIPFGRVRWIQKYASIETKRQIKAQQLIKKSKRWFYTALGGILAVPIIVIASFYLFLANSYYFSIENSYIVLRTGHPQLRFFPGFDQVVIQTDLQESSLDTKYREEIIRGEVTGFWFEKTEEGYQMWGEQLAERLQPFEHAQMQRVLGNSPNDIGKFLTDIIADSKTEPATRCGAAAALESLAQAKPELVTADMFNKLVDFVLTDSSYPKSCEARALQAFAQAKPEIVNADMFSKLVGFVVTDSYDSPFFVERSDTADALESLAYAKPEAVNTDMFSKLVDFVVTVPPDFYGSDTLRSNTANVLGSLVRANPKVINEAMLSKLVDFVMTNSSSFSSSDVNHNVPYAAARALEAIAQARPELVNADMLNKLLDFVITNSSDVSLGAASALGSLAQAKPKAVTTDMLNKLLDFVITNSSDANSDAASALGLLAQAKPEAITTDMLNRLLDFVVTNSSDASFGAAAALESLARAKPEVVNADMLNKMVNFIVTDSTGYDPANNVRLRAFDALRFLAPVKPEAVTTDMLNRLVDFILTDSSNADNIVARDLAAYVLGSLAQANPKAVTVNIINKLIDFLLSNSSNTYSTKVLRHAIDVLRSFAWANPEAVTATMLNRSLGLVIASNVRTNASSVLESLVQAKPDLVSIDMIGRLFKLLKSDTDAYGRELASRALFLIAFENKDEKIVIRKELEIMHDDSRPHWRMAASRTLEMLNIGASVDLVKATNVDLKKIEYLKRRFSDISRSDEGHLQYAAQVALEEIKKIEDKENK